MIPIEHDRRIGWLRFEVSKSKRVIYASLFVSTSDGVPLNFIFTRCDYPQTNGVGLSSVIGGMAQSCNIPPLVLLGQEGDLPTNMEDELYTVLPMGLIQQENIGFSTGKNSEGFFEQINWITQEPAEGSPEKRILLEVFDTNNPWDIFDRTGEALYFALSRPSISTLSSISGVLTPLSLLSGVDSGISSELWQILTKPDMPEIENLGYSSLQWPGILMPYQNEGVKVLTNLHRLLLADDMGLGKTVQAVAAIRILRKQKQIMSSLFVTPASLLDQWRQEFYRWAPELNAMIIRGSSQERGWKWQANSEVTLVSYDVLRQDAKYLESFRSAKNPWGVVVLDEAQKIKNSNKTSEVVKKQPRLRSWALTGTPLENHEGELASIIEFVDHVGKTTRKQFIAGPKLRKRHRQLQLRRKKSDVLKELPPKLETKLTIPLHPDQQKSYNRAESQGIVYLKSLGKDVEVHHILALITRLKQICNFDPLTGASSKMENISERLKTLTEQGHRALIFSQYKSPYSGVEAAAKYLKDFHPLTLTGDTPTRNRSALVQKFKKNDMHKALIISLKVGGTGLNLQEASYVFHLDRWWNPAVERQAEDRSHRMGQSVKVNVIKYNCKNTIEQRIDEIIMEKQELFDILVDDVSLDLSTRLNLKELLGLFGLD